MKTNSAFSMAVAMAAVAAISLMLVFVAQPDAVQADAPAAPTDLSARNAWLILPTTPEEGITLSWTAPEGTVTGYRILRQRSGCDDALVVHVEDTGSDETTYTDRDVLGGVTYNYRVKAINSEDIGPQSDAVTFEYGGNFLAGSGEIGGPEAPIGLDAWNVTGGIQLKWQEQDGWRARAGQTGYRILRRNPGQCEAFQVHAENTGSTSAYWKDTDVKVETRYEYRVVLFNRYGRGRQSDSLEATRWEKRYWAWGTISSITPRYTFEGFLNSSGTMAVGRLELDDDPDTVDYTWRGDVTRDSDGADADSCEGDGLGEDREVTEVNSRTTMFDFTIGGAGCRAGDYTINYVVHDRNGNEERSGMMRFWVIGVTIDGRAQVGETLSADVSTISDIDAFKGTTFTYQWYWYDRDDVSYTEIEGATSSTYTVVPGDLGKTIKVAAEFTDTHGQESGRESFATAAVLPANRAATGTPTISGTAQVGQTLTASTSGISDTDGLTNASYTYQWIWSDGTTGPGDTGTPFQSAPAGDSANSDITGATSATYAVTTADVDKAIKLRVDFTDDKGSVESLTSSATGVVPIEVTLAFSIDGTAVTCDSHNVHIVNLPQKECDNPSSIDQGASEEIEVEIEVAKSVNSQLYKFRFHIYQMEDSIGRYNTVEANDLCLGPGLADSVSMEVTPDDGTGNFAYTDEGTIFNMCPSGTYQLYVPWYRYNYEDEEYEHAGAFRRYFFINGDDKDDTSIEQVKFITASYPDTPVSHDEVQLEGTKQSTRLNRTLTTFALSIDGLVPDSDTETTDYVVRVRVIGDGGPDVAAIVGLGPRSVVPWCHVGNVGYSYLLKTVPENGRWAMDAHVLGNCLRGSWPDTLQVELFDGSDLANYIKGKDIALGALSNNAATGAPTISGTVEVGETLTADTSGITDADGLTNASYRYQWLSSRDTEIDRATSSTYTLADSDAGETIKVRVAFTDDAGNEETLTSDATGTVAEALPPSFWEGDLTVGKGTRDDTVWLGYTPFGGAFGSISLPRSVVVGQHTYSVQLVLHTSIDVYLGMSRELPEDFVLQVGDVEFDSEDASSEQLNEAFVYRWPNSALNWSEGDQVSVALWSDAMASALPENTPATGALAISGVPTVGQTLTAVTNGIRDANGMNSSAFRYQWILNEGGVDSEIAGAAAATYTLAETDEGKTIHVKVSFTDFARHQEAVVSPTVGPVAPRSDSPATGAPVISGTAQVGQTLTADTSGIADADGLDNATFGFRWLSGSDSEIDGATSSTYTLQNSDSGKTIKVRVTFTDDGGNEERLTSTPTATVSQLPTPLTASVHDEPDSHDGQNSFTFELRLSENLDGFSYKTLRDHAFSMSGGSVANARRLENSSNVRWEITVEPASDGDVSIVLPETTDCDDEGAVCASDGRMLSPGVTLTVAGPGGQEQQTAQENSPATGAPTIIGTVRVGETLTASTSAIADADGLGHVTFSYQWLTSGDTEIAGANSESYTLISTDEGNTIKVKVSFTDGGGNAETLTSATTAAVAGAPNGPATGAPTISGTARVAETLTVSTSGIADGDGLDDATFTYQWVRVDSDSEVDISGATNSTYALDTADQGKTVRVRVSFTDDAGNEETLTSGGTDVVSAPPPLTVGMENVATSHDGQAVFTFDLRFSVESGLSYKTLRDYAFTVTGGTVKKAQRLDKPSNIRWQITVEPGSNGAVTVVLPVTTDCTNQGAICTEDGRKLSSRLEFTVSGPGQ